MAVSGKIIEGKYVLKRQIGAGATAEVWLAEDRRLGKRWAVKILERGELRPEEKKQALAEALLIRDLNHPAIPRIVELGEKDGRLILVMDLVEGVTLEEVFRREGAQPAERVAAWGVQLADVLAYLHGCDPPVVYRDLKPANVILGPDGRLRLVDFGAAVRCGPGVTARGVGTPGYAAPELYREGPPEPAADLYSLGMTLAQLLSGRRPGQIGGLPLLREMMRAESGQIRLWQILRCCTRRDPHRRYAGAGSCRQAFSDCQKLLARQTKRSHRVRILRRGLPAAVLVSAVLTAASGFSHPEQTSVPAGASQEERLAACEKELRAGDAGPAACGRLLALLREDGRFTPEEARLFQRYYQVHKEHWNAGDAAVWQLSADLAEAYLKESPEEVSCRNRLLMAWPYLQNVADLADPARAECRQARALAELARFLAEEAGGTGWTAEKLGGLLPVLDALGSAAGDAETGTAPALLPALSEGVGLLRDMVSVLPETGMTREEWEERMDALEQAADAAGSGDDAAEQEAVREQLRQTREEGIRALEQEEEPARRAE